MAFLLDTNVVSELRRPRPHGAVLASSDAQLVTEACGRAAQELGLDRESS